MTNDDRATRAADGLAAYLGNEIWRLENHEDKADAVGDLICDLHHFCEREGIHIEPKIASAQMNFVAEQEEDAL